MPSMMVMMTKLAAEQMGGHGQGGSGGMGGGSRPPMGGSGSGGPPQGGSGSGGRPPMGGSGSGGNRPPGGSGSGRPPMGGSGNEPPPAGRAAKPQLLRESFNAEVTVGKKSYDCQFNMIYTAEKVDGKKSKARCKGIKKGAVKQVTVTSPNGFSFTMDMKFSAKGAAMSKITVEAGSSSGGSGGPLVTGSGSGRPPVGGSGSGRPPTGSGSGRPPVGGSGSGGPPTGGSGSGHPPIGGSGSGSGGPPMGGIGSDMCFCVDGEMMNGPMGGNGGNGGGPPGSGPPGSGRPPTGGSGSGSGRPPDGGSGSGRPPTGGSGSGGSGSGSSGGSGSGGSGGATSGPGVTVPNVPNPGSDGGTFEITIVQSWSQETDYARVTQVQVPPTAAGQKVPMGIDLHGNGGQGNLRRLSYLADGAVIVAPNGYERSWNVNNEGSKADDVSFILELISRVAEEHPAADANNVNLIGTSNGAAIIFRLLIATGVDRPFHRVFPMVSSMISVQWRDDSFWKSPDTLTNDYTVQTVPVFSDDFEYYHFHGTDDGTIAYEGKCPGPPFLGDNVCVVPAQQTDFLFAQAMGYTGEQIPDDDGVEIATNFVEYSYLDGRVKHFKDVGGTHGSTFGNANTKAVLEEVILGRAN